MTVRERGTESGAETAAVRRDLALAGAIGRLDRAFALVRFGGLALAARAWAASLPLAVLGIALYYVERVEGVTLLRAPFALALATAWWVRALGLVGVAREHVRRLWDGVPIPEGAGEPTAVLRTAAWTGIGLWAWSWLVVLGALAGPIGVTAVTPFFALRGAVAPSWIARAACTDEAGLRLLRRAIADSAGQRASGAAAELLLILGALALYVDLGGAIAVALLLGRSLLGIELALLDQFLSFRNTFAIVSGAVITMLLVEPIRAALSAIVFVEARVREEGLDLRAAIEDAIAHASRAGGRRNAGGGAARGAGTALAVPLALAVALVLVAGAGAARAQPPLPPPLPPELLGEDARARPRGRAFDDEVFDEQEPGGVCEDRRAALRDPATDPYALADAAADPYALADAAADPYAPADAAADPYALADPAADPYAPRDSAANPHAPRDPRDDEVRKIAADILARAEFREFEDTRGRGIRELIERLIEWLLRHRDPVEVPELSAPSVIPLPGPLFFVLLAAAIAAALIGIALATRRARPRSEVPLPTATERIEDPRERAPSHWVDDAARLAAEGRYREALRALYLATLVALDRRRLIRFDPTWTNGQYLRQMPESEARRAFRELTSIFEHTWYGCEPAGEETYRACRALAERIVAEGGGGA
jgi:hypothetical protein